MCNSCSSASSLPKTNLPGIPYFRKLGIRTNLEPFLVPRNNYILKRFKKNKQTPNKLTFFRNEQNKFKHILFLESPCQCPAGYFYMFDTRRFQVLILTIILGWSFFNSSHPARFTRWQSRVFSISRFSSRGAA